MKKILASSLVLVGLLWGQASNEATFLIENEEVAKGQNAAKPKRVNIDDEMNKAEKELKRKFNANPANAGQRLNVYSKTTAIDVGYDDPQYFDFLSQAYNEALLLLKADVVLKKAGEVAIEESFNYYNKQMPDNLRQKDLKAKIDAELEAKQSNDNADTFFQIAGNIINQITNSKSTPEEKKKIEAEVRDTIFEKAYTQGVQKDGFDSISGLVPYETFIVTNEDGELEIGILAYTTPKSLQLARDLRQGHKSKATTNTASCKSAEEIADSLDDDNLLSKLGVSYFYNENCRPALLAYGMSSYVKEDGMNADYRRQSQEFARSQADAFISNFLNSNVSASQKNTTTKQKTIEAMMKASQTDGKTSYGASGKEKVTALIKEMSQEIKSSSQMRLEGLEDARVWNIDNGDSAVVGVIRYYSMDSIEATRAEFAEPRSSSSSSSRKASSPGVKRNSNVIVDDF